MKQKKYPKAEPWRERLPGKKNCINSRDDITLARIPQQLARVILHDIGVILFDAKAPLRHLRPDPRAGGGYE